MRMQTGCPGDHVSAQYRHCARVETKEAFKQEGLIARMILAENNLID